MDFVPSLIGFLLALCHLTSRVRGEEATECGGVLDASKAGYITSPGYPLEYPPHQNCHWIITAPEPSQRIIVNFNPHFEIERLDCKYDFIEIRDGTSDNADVLGRHCSNIAPAPIISSGSSLQIRFVSDYAHQGAGFSLRYEIFKTDPDWGSCSLGVFICLACSGIHRNIPDISKVKSLRLGHWEDEEIKLMTQRGNELIKAKYEAAVPAYYYKPTHKDCRVLKEQWIRAKYERKEFTDPGTKLPYEDETKDGMLMKRGRDNGQFLSRRFVLSEREGTLKYFAKIDAKEPKAVIKVDTINATFQPEKTGNPNGLQLTFLKDYSTRSIFVYHESSKVIVDWFNSIRAVQLHYLKVAFPGATDAELVPKLTRNFLKEGFMEKTGPKQREGFKKRWFTLDHRRLMYFKDPMDAFAKGEVFLGNRSHGYNVTAGLPSVTHCNSAWQHGITLETPGRSFLFTCEIESDQQEWLKHFNDIMNTEMSPQDYTMEAMFNHRH